MNADSIDLGKLNEELGIVSDYEGRQKPSKSEFGRRTFESGRSHTKTAEYIDPRLSAPTEKRPKLIVCDMEAIEEDIVLESRETTTII